MRTIQAIKGIRCAVLVPDAVAQVRNSWHRLIRASRLAMGRPYAPTAWLAFASAPLNAPHGR